MSKRVVPWESSSYNGGPSSQNQKRARQQSNSNRTQVSQTGVTAVNNNTWNASCGIASVPQLSQRVPSGSQDSQRAAPIPASQRAAYSQAAGDARIPLRPIASVQHFPSTPQSSYNYNQNVQMRQGSGLPTPPSAPGSQTSSNYNTKYVQYQQTRSSSTVPQSSSTSAPSSSPYSSNQRSQVPQSQAARQIPTPPSSIRSQSFQSQSMEIIDLAWSSDDEFMDTVPTTQPQPEANMVPIGHMCMSP